MLIQIQIQIQIGGIICSRIISLGGRYMRLRKQDLAHFAAETACISLQREVMNHLDRVKWRDPFDIYYYF